MESWRATWRKGLAPLLPTAGLEALAKALREDDGRLLQGRTTTPLPLVCVQDWPVEAACAIGYVFWQAGVGKETVADVEEAFAEACYQCDQLLNEPAGCRWFLNFFDETPRDEVRRLLLEEVELVLAQRAALP